jgi:hypothetical protein
MGLLRCAALALLAGAPALAIRPGELKLAGDVAARRATLAQPAVDAGSARNLLLFGLTQRDKAAHDEHRDAMIEARNPPRALPASRLQASRMSLPLQSLPDRSLSWQRREAPGTARFLWLFLQP